MDNAFCTEDGLIYGVFEFSCLPRVHLDRKRRLLQCPKCGGPAFFRNASQIGRAPCFGARPHADGCSMASQDYIRPEYDADDDQGSSYNTNRRIVLDFNYGAHAQPEHSRSHDYTHHSDPDEHDYGNGNPNEAPIHRRARSLLRALIESPGFSDCNLLIDIDGQQAVPARDFFVPLASVSHRHLGNFSGFWGLVSDVRMSNDKSTVWFNSGGRDNVSFCLSSKHMGEFNRRFAVSDEEDLAGAYILVLGTLRLAENGKLYCVIEDLGHMALRLT